MAGSMQTHSSKVVSSESEELILVDNSDLQTGTLSKAESHDGDGVLHRAFSLFAFDTRGHLLLQQRSAEKRLWPLYWSNSCCSHPRSGESMQTATQRRIEQELGITAELEFVYKFAYHARYRDLGSERELCSVFLGRIGADVKPNENEIAAVRYVEPSALSQALQDDADIYTPWFQMEWRRLNEDFSEQLSRYTTPDRLR